MAVLYANRIIEQSGQEEAFTIDNVPNLWKSKTLTELSNRGYDGNGNLL
ncbi:hypothetical protein [Bacillus sp. FJAT-49736]|nr:hypothetical protein [Bacillus sp. FJAT-49736]MBS4171950.1 hypothetical protein [Bacillus sp. FJAT-49736]